MQAPVGGPPSTRRHKPATEELNSKMIQDRSRIAEIIKSVKAFNVQIERWKKLRDDMVVCGRLSDGGDKFYTAIENAEVEVMNLENELRGATPGGPAARGLRPLRPPGGLRPPAPPRGAYGPP